MHVGHEVVPVCPEVLGGLPTPRKPAEIVDGVVKRKDDLDFAGTFTIQYEDALWG